MYFEIIQLIIFLLIFFLLIYLFRIRASRKRYEKKEERQMGSRTMFDVVEEMQETILNQWGRYVIIPITEGLFTVEDVEVKNKIIIAKGKLTKEATDAYEVLKLRCQDSSYTPLLQESDEKGKENIILIPKIVKQSTPNPMINVILFLITLLTTLFAGAELVGVDVLKNPSQIFAGIPFSISIMLILGIHELGHYFVAKSYGLSVTLPYFIPSPIGLGTFGAFIQMRSPAPTRKSIFDVGLAGPLMSLAASILCLSIGLNLSSLTSKEPPIQTDMSFLLDLFCKLKFDGYSENLYVTLHPVAFAGFIGMWVTALNLIPIGQLDGGHISYAMFGKKNFKRIAYSIAGALAIFTLAGAEHLIMLLILIFFLVGFQHQPPLNDISKLNKSRLVVGIVALIIALLILIPVPQFKI